MRILLAAFYTPGIRALETLFQMGYSPPQLRLLTHETSRNECLLAFARAHAIETRTFSVKSAEALAWINGFAPDLICSMYFRDILPRAVLEIPRCGAMNLHPALLPRYRGTFSVPWVLINGEPVTGFTYHYMTAAIDAGNIILQKEVLIGPRDTAYSLYHRMIAEGLAAFRDALGLVVEEQTPGSLQQGDATYYSRAVPFEGYIDPHWSREQIDRFIRAMYFPPFTGAKLRLSGGEEKELSTIDEYDAVVRKNLNAV